MSDGVSLTAAISGYAHTDDLACGRVRPVGVDLHILSLPIEEIFYRFLRYREWHVSELSLAKYVSLRAAGDETLTAIPVFPSRVCRHSSIFVRRGGITHPKQLSGARVGVPEWAQTASVYTRALLMHEWGIPLADVEWLQAGVNQPGRREKVALQLPEGVSLTPVPDRSLGAMLVEGDIDAVLSAHPPRVFEDGHPEVVRLFADYEAVERDYVTRTGIFPIMHVVVLRSDVAERWQWVAANLLAAFEEAKELALARLEEMTASRLPVPWIACRVEDSRRLLGGDPWPYGVEANRTTLEAFTRFAHEQGVARRRVAVEELFAPQVLGSYRV
jgi:4,5-dihydroxyphthalate decarboxylase